MMPETDYEVLFDFVARNETTEIAMEPCHPIPAYKSDFVTAMRVIVTFVSILSLFGAGLIIVTYVAFKEHRTKARQILVQLSIADILVAVAHIFGVNVTLPKFTNLICDDFYNATSDVLCQVQGGIAVFSTTGSYLWTIAVAYYFLVIIVFESQKIGKLLLIVSYPICWGFPAILVIILGVQGYLGFQPNLDASKSYCSVDCERTGGVYEFIKTCFASLLILKPCYQSIV